MAKPYKHPKTGTLYLRRKTVLLMRLDLAVAQIYAAAYPDRKTLIPIWSGHDHF